MTANRWIDDAYAAFLAGVPPCLAEPAATLAVRLGLAPSRDVPWSEVFGHEVTLAAPALVAEAMPHVPEDLVRDAVAAHMLAVVEAFGTDRVEDGQVAADADLEQLLELLRIRRDEALARVGGAGGGASASASGRAADATTAAAIREERRLLSLGEAVSMARYEEVSLGKQRVGFPASIELARAAGWDARRTAVLEDLLGAVWMGLQLHDDVLDWRDDLARGGAWAACIALGMGATPSGGAPPDVLASGALAAMLERSRRYFRAARRRAAALGAARLSGWAATHERRVGDLARRERESAGFAQRAHALAAWAREVLA